MRSHISLSQKVFSFFCSLASLLSSLSSSQKATLVAFVFSKGYTGDNLPDPYHIAFGLCVLKSKLDLVFRLQKRINKVRPWSLEWDTLSEVKLILSYSVENINRNRWNRGSVRTKKSMFIHPQPKLVRGIERGTSQKDSFPVPVLCPLFLISAKGQSGTNNPQKWNRSHVLYEWGAKRFSEFKNPHLRSQVREAFPSTRLRTPDSAA